MSRHSIDDSEKVYNTYQRKLKHKNNKTSPKSKDNKK